MKTYYAYVRVSTTRQGEEGVSLQEQKRAILEYAGRRKMRVSEWFEEQISAAKRGRPVFSRLVTLLKARRHAGVIIHKIDRGARNLRDWADIGELMDRGIEVHFAHESIDLHTRSGRLSADILAVVAADYIRNLREEVVKGINGRLRQGLFPFAAPIGYLDNGSGKVKTVDPLRGPYVKEAFDLYASRKFPLRLLSEELFRRGFRTKTGKLVHVSQLATMLRNPFYIGLIRLQNRKDTYPGLHAPLVSSTVFNRVQMILDGKRSKHRHQNRFLLRLMIQCEHCKLGVSGEIQKGHVYYRCHRRTCPTTCIREERFVEAILGALKRINIGPEDRAGLDPLLREMKEQESAFMQSRRRELEGELQRLRQKTTTILNRFLDGSVPKVLFDEEHTSLLMERTGVEEKLSRLESGPGMHERIASFLADLETIVERFCTGSQDEVRQIIDQVFEAITTSGSATITLKMKPVFECLFSRNTTAEAWKAILPQMIKELGL